MSTTPGGDTPRDQTPGPEPTPARPPVPPVPEPGPVPPVPEPGPPVPEPGPPVPEPGPVPPVPEPTGPDEPTLPEPPIPVPEVSEPPVFAEPPPETYPPAGYPPPPPPGYAPQSGQQVPGAYPTTGYVPAAPPSLWGLAISDGWHAFGRVAGVFIGAAVVWFLIAGAVIALVSAIFRAGSTVDVNGRGFAWFVAPGFSFRWLLLQVVVALVIAFVEAAFVRNALAVTRGARPTFSEFFRFEHAGPVAVLALVIAAINLVVGLVSWIPGIGWLVQLAVGFFLMFSYYVLLDRGLAPIDAVRQGVLLASRNAPATVVFYLLAGLILLAGFIACGVGAFVSAPLVVICAAYLYRRLTGEQPRIPT